MTDHGWDALLAGLRTLGPVEEIAPGRTVVEYDGRTVTIVMTGDQWDELWTVAWGEVESALASTLEDLRALPDVPYAVYQNYGLHPSDTAVLPEDPAVLRIRQRMREHPGEIVGQWYAEPPDRR